MANLRKQKAYVFLPWLNEVHVVTYIPKEKHNAKDQFFEELKRKYRPKDWQQYKLFDTLRGNNGVRHFLKVAKLTDKVTFVNFN